MTDRAQFAQNALYNLPQQPDRSEMSSGNNDDRNADGVLDDQHDQQEGHTNYIWGSAFSSLEEAEKFQQAGVRKWEKLAKDDWQEVKQDSGAWAKRLGNLLFAAHVPAEEKYTVQRKIDAYLRGQTTARGTLKRCTKTEELRKLLEATLMKVVSTAVQIHEQEGFPERYMIFYEQVGRGIKPEESYTCKTRLLAIEKAVHDNKRTGSDLCEGKFEELVYAPQAYLKRKFDNVGSNANKEERQDAGREVLGGKKRNRRTGSQASSSSNGSSGGETVPSEAKATNIEISDSSSPELRRNKSQTAGTPRDSSTTAGASIPDPAWPEYSGAGGIDQTSREEFGAIMQEQLRQAFPERNRQASVGQLPGPSVKNSRDAAINEAQAFKSRTGMQQGRPSRKRQREAANENLHLETLPPSKIPKPDEQNYGTHYSPRPRTASAGGQNQPWQQPAMPRYNTQSFPSQNIQRPSAQLGAPTSYGLRPHRLGPSYGNHLPSQTQPGLYGPMTGQGPHQYGDRDPFAISNEQLRAGLEEQNILLAQRGNSPPQPDNVLGAASESFSWAGEESVPRDVSTEGGIEMPAEVRLSSDEARRKWLISRIQELDRQNLHF